MDEPKYVERKFNQIEPRSILRNGDFLMNIVGASIGRTAIFNIDALANINQAVCLIRVEAKNVVDSSYLLNFFNSETCLNYMYDKQVDNARANLSLGNIGRFLIPLPPLEEQHRILAKVDELMALCDRLDAQQADAESAHTLIVKTLLETLTQSKDPAEFANGWERIKQNFDTLFTTEASIDALKQTLLQLAVMGKLVPQDPNDEAASELLKRLIDQKVRLEQETNRKPGIVSQSTSVTKLFGEPNSWVWARFNDVVQISSGVTLGKKLDDKMTVSKPYLRVANVQRGYLVLDQIKEIEILPEHVEKYVLRVNDLLLTEGGDWDKVGRTAIWRGEIPECLHQNHIFKARRLLPELDVGWAQLYLNSPIARSYFEASAKQTTNLASINMTQLRNCPFPLPPLAEQRRIVAKVEELGGLCDRLKAALISARTFQHLLATTLIVGAVNNSALAPQEKEQVMAFR
jgi:type I restriction enzyme S subunit